MGDMKVLSRRRITVTLIGLAVLCLCASALFAPVFAPDERIDPHLDSETHLVARTHDVFDNLSNASHSPYGPIESMEVRRRERRDFIQVAQGYTSVIAVLRTDRGLVVERVSCSDLQLGRFATLTHTELRPDDVPSGVLTDAETRQHQKDANARGTTARPYTTGGYDG